MRKHNETQSIRERIRHLAITEDIYYKKTLKFRAWKQEFLFRVSQDLFSSFDIDKGTRLLLRTVLEAGYEYDSVLDMGCGYGPLGLIVKKLRPLWPIETPWRLPMRVKMRYSTVSKVLK